MGPSRLRFCSRRRWPYSSVRSSSLRAMRTLLSVPTAKRPPAAANRGASKMPSPRLASVMGHRPATAPDLARRALSSGVMCVQWIRHQRAIEPHVVEQPFDRARAGPGHAVLHLARLLGGVDVDRAGGPMLDERAQLGRIDGAQRMRRDAEDGAVQALDVARGSTPAGARSHRGRTGSARWPGVGGCPPQPPWA